MLTLTDVIVVASNQPRHGTRSSCARRTRGSPPTLTPRGAGDLLNFGHVAIAEDGSLVLNLRDVKGESLFKLELPKP